MSRETKSDRENPEWTVADFRKAKSGTELPEELAAAFPRMRGRQKTPTKVAVSLRLSQEVVEYYRASGAGWQSRIDEVLKRTLPVK